MGREFYFAATFLAVAVSAERPIYAKISQVIDLLDVSLSHEADKEIAEF